MSSKSIPWELPLSIPRVLPQALVGGMFKIVSAKNVSMSWRLLMEVQDRGT